MADVVSICNLALSYLGDSANMVAINAPEKALRRSFAQGYTQQP